MVKKQTKKQNNEKVLKQTKLKKYKQKENLAR